MDITMDLETKIHEELSGEEAYQDICRISKENPTRIVGQNECKPVR